MLRSGVHDDHSNGAVTANSKRYVEPMTGRRTHRSKNPLAKPPTRALLALMEEKATATTFLKTAAQEEEDMSADGRDAHKMLKDAGLKRADLAAISSDSTSGGSSSGSHGNAVSFLDVSTRVGGIAGGSACDENDECTSGFCGERWSGNCGCWSCICGICTSNDYTLNGGAACGLDRECKYRYCAGNGGGLAPTYGAGRCTTGGNGARCYDVNGCKAGHACVNGRCSDKAVGSACSSNGGCASGSCDVTTGAANVDNIDTEACLYPAASRAGGLSCTLNSECQYGWCKDNFGGMTSTPGTGRCTSGQPGAECGDSSNCRSGRCDETGMQGGMGTDKCLYPAGSRQSQQSCTLDDDCAWNFCAGNGGGMTTSWNTGKCTSGLPGAQCKDDVDCQGASECDNDLLGGVNTDKVCGVIFRFSVVFFLPGSSTSTRAVLNVWEKS